MSSHLTFNVAAGDPDSGPSCCVESTLPTKSSPQSVFIALSFERRNVVKRKTYFMTRKFYETQVSASVNEVLWEQVHTRITYV